MRVLLHCMRWLLTGRQYGRLTICGSQVHLLSELSSTLSRIALKYISSATGAEMIADCQQESFAVASGAVDHGRHCMPEELNKSAEAIGLRGPVKRCSDLFTPSSASHMAGFGQNPDRRSWFALHLVYVPVVDVILVLYHLTSTWNGTKLSMAMAHPLRAAHASFQAKDST